MSSRRQGTAYVGNNYTVANYPEELKSKVYLLKHFESYIMGKLYGDYDYILRFATYQGHAFRTEIRADGTRHCLQIEP
jgi:hypothetical protein